MNLGFDEVLGQERAKGLMRAALSQNRMGHAYLFSGPDGIGKALFAQQVGAALLCKGKGERPCGNCPECRLTASDNHPDLNLIEPQGKARIIKIDQIRDLITFMSLRPVQADHRVAVLRDADTMEEAGSNALLKTLEEPPAFALLILTAAQPRTLPATIRSRCQEVRFGPLKTDDVEKVLLDVGYEHGDELASAAALSDGSPGRAVKYLESEILTAYSAMMPRVAALPREDLFDISDDLLGWVRGAGKELQAQRERLLDFLELMAKTYARIARSRTVESNADGSPLAAALRNVPAVRLPRIIEHIWDARRQVDANASPELIILDMLEQIANLQGTADGAPALK